MNKVFLIGNLTKAPDARTTQTGVSVTTFSLAVTRNRDREKCDFFNIVTWRGLADNCAKFLDKGKKVSVIGEIQNRSYEANDGTKRFVTEIVADEVEFLTPKTDRVAHDEPTAPVSDNNGLVDVPNDDLPF